MTTPRAVSPSVVDRIVRRYRAGATLRRIANELDAAGEPTASGRVWRHSTIAGVLHRQGVEMRPRGTATRQVEEALPVTSRATGRRPQTSGTAA